MGREEGGALEGLIMYADNIPFLDFTTRPPDSHHSAPSFDFIQSFKFTLIRFIITLFYIEEAQQHCGRVSFEVLTNDQERNERIPKTKTPEFFRKIQESIWDICNSEMFGNEILEIFRHAITCRR